MMKTLQLTSWSTLQSTPKPVSQRWLKRFVGVLVGASALAIGMGISNPAFATLQMGYSGTGVSNLQSTLASLGHYSGPITGYFGDMTRSAVMSYQVSHGLAPDGVVGDRTLNCLLMDAGTPPSQFSSASAPAPTVTTQAAPVVAPTPVPQPQVTTQVVQQPVVQQPQVVMIPMMLSQSVPTQTVVTPTAVTSTAVAPISTVTSQSTVTNQSTTTSSVRLGSSGPRVTEVQQLLVAVGYAVPVTGYFGPNTQSSVIGFQQSNGLAADGVVGPQTLTVLRSGGNGGGGAASSSFQVASTGAVSGSSLRMGTSGQRVTQLQQALSRSGYSVPSTGYFGEMTLTAVRQFQAARGLTVDGVVGPSTLAQLGI